MRSCTSCSSRFLIVAIVIAGFSVIAATALGQVINEDIKLMANDGEEDDGFSMAIAFDQGIVAVGALWDDDNGTNSGSAYLFDATTGVQLFKLVPSDGEADERFSSSIAIKNGIVAVGAFSDNDNGVYSGSAYLFDASSGVQITKLLLSDGIVGDWFGESIAIDGDVVAIGARGANATGDLSGSVYLFDVSTGVQKAELTPNDDAAAVWFGHSIAIDNGVVAVGAFSDDINGDHSGSVYVFNTTTGALITKLIPNDGAAGDFFGISVIIDNGIIAIGAYADDDNGIDSGSAYLFDITTGVQIAKLLPH